MKNLSLTIISVFLLVMNLSAFAQETLQEKYDNMIESTETYEQYKVIPRRNLNALWSEVIDTLNQKSQSIANLESSIASQETSIETLQNEKADLQIKLDESLTVNDSISFLGIPFSKLAYHLMVWLIIIVLTILGLISYFMFLRSNKVTVRVKREYETLNDEFEAQKTKAREAQVKLKRELQTAVNQLNERRS